VSQFVVAPHASTPARHPGEPKRGTEAASEPEEEAAQALREASGDGHERLRDGSGRAEAEGDEEAMTPETAANYLLDLGMLLKKEALDARARARLSKGSEGDFDAGRAFAYYEVISLMQQQAHAFLLPLEALSLADIDADRDLLS
jgi:hypothetical protein